MVVLVVGGIALVAVVAFVVLVERGVGVETAGGRALGVRAVTSAVGVAVERVVLDRVDVRVRGVDEAVRGGAALLCAVAFG